MIFTLLSLINRILHSFIIPSICAYCRKFLYETNVFCSECKSKIFPIVSKNIDVTAHFPITILAISDYKDPLKKLILAKGWSDILASYQMGQLLWEMTPLQHLDYDMIVPIPLHWTRYAWRGFNQADVIAKVIQKKRTVPLCHILKRIKKTKFQSILTSNMRSDNVKNAFILKNVKVNDYLNKHILLVDDLMTTGSTLCAAAKTLLALKPKKITVTVVCRTI